MVSLAIVAAFRNHRLRFTRQLNLLEKASTKELGKMTGLAVEALETVQRVNAQLTEKSKYCIPETWVQAIS